MIKYKIYAENAEGDRRYLDTAFADETGKGLFDLYSDDCDDEEQILIVAE